MKDEHDGKAWHDGSCCCNCKNQMQVNKHPWNSGEAKGSISEKMGYVCLAMTDEHAAIFFDRQHGMCEMHERK